METASLQQPRYAPAGNRAGIAAPHLVLGRRSPGDVLQALLVVGGHGRPPVPSLPRLVGAVPGLLRGGEP